MNSRSRIALSLLCLAGLALPMGGLRAGTTGKITGKAVDRRTGEPLIGVNIMVEKTMLGAATDLDGTYFIIMIPPGTFSVRATMMGYKEMRIDRVLVNIDKTTTLDFQLEEEAIQGETVTVVASRPIVQMDLTSTEAVVSSEIIDQLPLDRVGDIVNLQAGVIDGHIRGGRSGEVMTMIDGIAVNDVYSGESAFEVENNAIAELQVISGTFNAEYGQAMSGVINIVTKDGGDDYKGEITTYIGDYLSTHSDLFWNVKALNPTASVQGNLSGPFPILKKYIKVFLSGRYYTTDGYLYGKDIFSPSDRSDFTADDPARWTVMSHGTSYPFSDSLARALIDNAEAVPMNPSDRITFQGKISLKPSSSDDVVYEYLLQNDEYQDYDHQFFFNPSGNYRRFQQGTNHRLVWTHVVSRRTFFDVGITTFDTKYKQYVLEDPFDGGYVSTDRLQDAGANAFLTGGMEMWHFKRNTTTSLAKASVVSQITNTHQIKAGLEGQYNRLWLHEYQVTPELPGRIPPRTTFSNNTYTHYPVQASVYIQDKMEYKDIIVNAGIRFDTFRPNASIPEDFTDPGASAKSPAPSSSQLSPRFGIAYPVTDRGVIHISYGHFFQIPNYDFLYANPEFDIYPLQSTPSSPPHSMLNTVGNADLKPQKTVIYEIGLQQQLTRTIGLDVTGYYKDIRNLLGTRVYQTLQGIRYGRYINRDYGNIRGVTVSLEERGSSGLSFSMDYTFQIARGNASDPNSAFLDAQTDPPQQTEKQMVPLNWDRRHQLNLTTAYGKPGNYTVSVIGRLGTGLPYTPAYQNVQTAVENSARRPSVMTMDLYGTKTLKIMGFDFSVFLRIYNLLDRKNELDVFADTGRAGYSLAPLYVGGLRPRGLNSLDAYYLRPDFYSAPREIELGFSMEF